MQSRRPKKRRTFTLSLRAQKSLFPMTTTSLYVSALTAALGNRTTFTLYVSALPAAYMKDDEYLLQKIEEAKDLHLEESHRCTGLLALIYNDTDLSVHELTLEYF